MYLRAVLFDFDFTLVDASLGVVQSINYALEQMGLDPAPPERILPTIGLSLQETLTILAGPEQAERLNEFHDFFVSKADQVMTALTRVFEATPEVLRTLRAWGLKLAICTSKYRYRVEDIFQRYGLDGAVDVIIGADDVAHLKPHPEPLERALAALGVAPQEALYVGDSAADAEAAYRAGIPFIAVRSGCTPQEALEAFPRLAQLSHVGELPAWLEAQGILRAKKA